MLEPLQGSPRLGLPPARWQVLPQRLEQQVLLVLLEPRPVAPQLEQLERLVLQEPRLAVLAQQERRLEQELLALPVRQLQRLGPQRR